MKNLTTAILIGLGALLSTACGGADHHASSAAAAAVPGPAKAPGTAKIGDKTTCPVSGEEFVVTADSPKAEHEGKTYYFCCPGCDKKFKADPKKFLKTGT
jgi:Cu+-exporting ATPase